MMAVRQPQMGSGLFQDPGLSQGVSLNEARRIYIQRGPSGFGFLFSTNAGPQMNHFISRVDEGSPAAICGLKLGDRILKVNDMSISNTVHKSVVKLIQESPEGVPLRLVVAAPMQIGSPMRMQSPHDVTSLSSEAISNRSQSMGNRLPGQATHPDHLRTVLVCIRNPENGLLLAHRLNHVRFGCCL